MQQKNAMQLLVFKFDSRGMLELIEQGELRDDEDEITIPLLIASQSTSQAKNSLAQEFHQTTIPG